MLEKTDENSLAELYNNFELSDPVSEEEFDEALDKVTQFLLFKTPWGGLKVSRKINLLNDMPLICKIDDCPFAAKCSVLKNTPQARKAKLLGTACREEKLYGVEQFSALIKELEISPEQTTDIINVTSLVRLLIVKRRMDLYLAVDGTVLNEVGVTNARTGASYEKKVLHPVFKEYEKVEKQIHALQSQLMASRKDRASLAATVGKSANILKDLFAGRVGTPAIIDADFEEFEDQGE